MGIWFGTTESKGPYGYVCLGLDYFKEEDDVFALKKMVLVVVDMTLKKCIEPLLYTDRFEHSIDGILEKDGMHYCRSFMGDDIPILNYDMLNIPQKLECKDGAPLGTGNQADKCRMDRSGKKYEELYSCVLDYDKNSLTGDVIGFDGLGRLYLEKTDMKDRQYTRIWP